MSVLVVAEHIRGQVRDVTRELITAGRELGPVTVAVISVPGPTISGSAKARTTSTAPTGRRRCDSRSVPPTAVQSRWTDAGRPTNSLSSTRWQDSVPGARNGDDMPAGHRTIRSPMAFAPEIGQPADGARRVRRRMVGSSCTSRIPGASRSSARVTSSIDRVAEGATA